MASGLPSPLVGLSMMLSVLGLFAAVIALEGNGDWTDCPATAACFWVALVLSAASIVVGLSARVM